MPTTQLFAVLAGGYHWLTRAHAVQMGVAEAGRLFEAVAQQPVHSAVKEHHRLARHRFLMGDIVAKGTHVGPGQVAGHA